MSRMSTTGILVNYTAMCHIIVNKITINKITSTIITNNKNHVNQCKVNWSSMKLHGIDIKKITIT